MTARRRRAGRGSSSRRRGTPLSRRACWPRQEDMSDRRVSSGLWPDLVISARTCERRKSTHRTRHAAVRSAWRVVIAGCICVCASPAVTLAAATTRRTGTPPSTTTRRSIRSFAHSRRASAGGTATRTISSSNDRRAGEALGRAAAPDHWSSGLTNIPFRLTSQCTCGPPVWPVIPISAIGWPCTTRSPTATSDSDVW